jgi:hypothetical protein
MMKTLHRALAAVALLVSAAAPAAAQGNFEGLRPDDNSTPTRQGTRGANFLEIGVDARGQAMAGAIVSWTDSPSALYWNPSGIANVETFTVEATRQNLYADLDIAHNFGGIALPALGGVLGAHVITLSSGEIDRTTPAFPEGGDPQFGNTFEWTSMAVGVSYARRLTDRLSIGASGKVISEGLSDARTSWGALDVGTQFNTGIYGLTIGAAVLNIGPASEARGTAIERNIEDDDFSPQRTEIMYATEQSELPTLFRFSVGMDLLGRAGSVLSTDPRHKLLVEAAFNDAIDTDLQFAGGVEYSFNNLVFLRGGKRFYNDDRATGDGGMYGLSGGAGVRLPLGSRALRFDYAYMSLGDLENVQVFTFGFGR